MSRCKFGYSITVCEYEVVKRHGFKESIKYVQTMIYLLHKVQTVQECDATKAKQ